MASRRKKDLAKTLFRAQGVRSLLHAKRKNQGIYIYMFQSCFEDTSVGILNLSF